MRGTREDSAKRFRQEMARGIRLERGTLSQDGAFDVPQQVQTRRNEIQMRCFLDLEGDAQLCPPERESVRRLVYSQYQWIDTNNLSDQGLRAGTAGPHPVIRAALGHVELKVTAGIRWIAWTDTELRIGADGRPDSLEEQRQFYLDRCQNVRLARAADFLMPVAM